MGDILDSIVAFIVYTITVPVEKRTFTDVVFKSSNLANLTNPRRCGNGTSALGVLYPFVTEQSGSFFV